MPAGWAAGAMAVGTVAAGYMSSQAAKSAASTQADAARYAADANSAAAAQQLETAKPWVKAGETAINQLSAMTQPGGAATQEFAYQPFQYQADPGYGFRFNEGMKAMNASAAARGGLISGNALRAGQAYGQEMGSQEYANAFDRYLKNYANAQNTFQLNRNNLLEPLKFISGQGQAGAANQASVIGANAAANSALTTGAANANAAGQIGSANAYSNAIGQGIGMYQTNQLLNRFAPQGQSSYGSSPTTSNFGDGWGSYGGGSAPAAATDLGSFYG